MTRLLYSILLTLALPFLLLRLLWRSPAYRQRIPERLGRKRWPDDFDPRQLTIWIHAVSVGETVAAAPLLQAIRQRWPQAQIVFTTMTPTGSERVAALFSDVFHCYLPYDLPYLLKPLLTRTKPDVLIVMETELWPNLLHCCQQQQVKVMLANARLSARSARGYGRIAGLTRRMLGQLDIIAAQADGDAGRLLALGAESERVHVTGSLKFNVAAATHDVPEDSLFKSLQDAQRPIWIAASTREKDKQREETQVFQAFQQALQQRPDLLLLLIPRHPERFDAVAAEAQSLGFNVQRRSEATSLLPETQVLIGDSMGEMASYYQCADLAFVGGSLVDTGCQNVLEPAALGMPILVGPSQYNFAAICTALESAGALQTVANATALAQAVVRLLADPDRMAAMGQAGKELVAANQQALPKQMVLLEKLLGN